MVHEHYLDFSYAPVVYREDVPPGMERLPAFNEIEVTEKTVSYTRLLPRAPLVLSLGFIPKAHRQPSPDHHPFI